MDGAIATGMLKGMVEHEYPITLGRDFVGTMEAASDGVTSVGAGDEVFGAVPAMSSTIHAGIWAELISVAETNLVRRPSSVAIAVAGLQGGRRSRRPRPSTRSLRRRARRCSWSARPAASGPRPTIVDFGRGVAIPVECYARG
jgi:hypothetical protein